MACVQHQNSSKLQQPWEELQTETTLLLFTPHFSPHKLASIQIVLSMFTPWDLLVFYLGYRLHIIYLHCILNGWVKRAFILCWKDEKDPG